MSDLFLTSGCLCAPLGALREFAQSFGVALFEARQAFNQYAFHRFKLLIPSEITGMLTQLCAFSSTAPPTVRIIHSGHACNVEEERHTERVYTIREGETLELTCLVTGHPRPQVGQPASTS